MAQVLTRARVEAFYKVYLMHDFARIAEFLHEDVDWSVSGPVDLITYCGVRKGRDEVMRVMQTAIPEIFKTRRFEVERLLVDGDQAAALAQLTGEKHDGRIARYRVAHFSRYRDGKIAQFRSVIDSFNAVEQILGVHLNVGEERSTHAPSLSSKQDLVAL